MNVDNCIMPKSGYCVKTALVISFGGISPVATGLF